MTAPRGMRSLMFASAVRKAWLRARSGGRVEFDEPVYFGPSCAFEVARDASFAAGQRVHFRRNCMVEVNGSGRVEVGADTTFTYNVVIQCSTSIRIGERCAIGASLIVDGSHRFRDLDTPVLEQGYDFRPITIGDDAWIGIGAVIMADVGDRAVVGANAVVVDPVPPYTVVGGVPARVLSTFGPDSAPE